MRLFLTVVLLALILVACAAPAAAPVAPPTQAVDVPATEAAQRAAQETEAARLAAEQQQTQVAGELAVQQTQEAQGAAATQAAQNRQATRAAIEGQKQATADALSAILTPLGITGQPTSFRAVGSGAMRYKEAAKISVADFADGIKNFMVVVTFINPTNVTAHEWDYGILFRNTGPNVQYRLVIRSNRTWELTANRHATDGARVIQGKLDRLKTGEKDANEVRLVVNEAQGWFFLNGELVSALKLADLQDPGWVSLATLLYQDSYFKGGQVDYENGMMWVLP